jgi:hypothetical protein
MKKLKPGRKKLKLKAELIKDLSTHNLKQLHGGYHTGSGNPDCDVNSGVSDAVRYRR